MPTRDWMNTLSQIHSESKGNRKYLGSRGSIVARRKLKRIDGRAPPGVEFAAQLHPTAGNLPESDERRIDRLRVLS